MNLHTKIYTPQSNRSGIATVWREMLRDLISSQNLAKRFAIRDIRATYRQSVFGILWAFFTPLVNTMVWIFLNQAGVVKTAASPIPYPAYVFTGTMLWSILTESLLSPLSQTQSSRGIMSKINFPKEALILSGISKIFFNTSIKVVLLIGVLFLMGVLPGWQLLLFPLAVFSLILFGISIGLVLTPIGMLYGDIGRAIPLLMQFAMYLSPVVFIISGNGVLTRMMNLNPLTPLILNARNWLTGFDAVQTGYFIGINIVAVFILFLGWLFYRMSIPVIIERTS
ncbi:MAG: ABC transporter permease [Crocinitomicaceae bacterium]|nr:ABC transporter permease [Crocinitomicaceae bacterium]